MPALLTDTLHELPSSAICQRRGEIGMVFQHSNLLANMTTLEHVIEALVRVPSEPRSLATERALTLLRRVGLDSTRDAHPP